MLLSTGLCQWLTFYEKHEKTLYEVGENYVRELIWVGVDMFHRSPMLPGYASPPVSGKVEHLDRLKAQMPFSCDFWS
jgi:hypothetical protein